jgi:hypothetical protein
MLKPQSTLTDPGWIVSNGEHWGLGLALKNTPYGIRYYHSGSNGDFKGAYIFYEKQKSGFVVLSNSNLAGDLFDNLEPYFTDGIRK